MEQLVFDFPEGMNDIDKANHMMMHIVNRGAGFNRTKYSHIILTDLEDNVIDFMLYKTITILSIARGVDFFVPRNSKKLVWINKTNDNQHFYWTKWVNLLQRFGWYSRNGQPLSFSTYLYPEQTPEYVANPNIFAGVTKEDLKFIANALYDYREPEER